MRYTFTSAAGIERCDLCEETVGDCWCVCNNCGGSPEECGCDELAIAR
jgi:hypothetical protein